MHHLLNGLHRSRVGLYTRLSFKEGQMHPLEPAWTSQVPIIVEDNMPNKKPVLIISSEKRTTPRFRFRTSITLRNLACDDIHKPRLLHSFCFLGPFIIIGVCFRINYHDLIGQTT
ncbi:DNA-directed RNA polymerases II, IV and V subunit 3-like [Pyrus ussuriensis x Pyrus communis]|uniref:DNA-directed RNA polymerases II, IV and V subunit 3-like n=1 Tax=Pyrus ussuriensis x Pyrus communis TaxID=2448454 RepID=A0A5N5GFS5_9ROSA|nr:DNA-directed RNA polymerases II, IV and V subunit 3-like [Pyrus ussuriensis x Pyrus communis]